MHTNFDKCSEIYISQPNTVFPRISVLALIVFVSQIDPYFFQNSRKYYLCGL